MSRKCLVLFVETKVFSVDVLLKGESDLDYSTSNEVVKAVLNDMRPIGTDTIFLSDIKMSDVWNSISSTDVALDIRTIKLAAGK